MIKAQKFSFKNVSLSVKVVALIVITIFLWMLSGIFKHSKSLDLTNQNRVEFKSIASKAITHQQTLKTFGYTEGSKVVDLKSEAEGKIIEIIAKQGQLLNEGDIILKIDSKNLNEKIEHAKADLKNKNLMYSSTVNLFNKKLSSDAALSSALTLLKDAEANLKAAQFELDNTKLLAPFKGRLDVINVHKGDYISLMENKTLAKFFAYDPMKVIINVSQNTIRDIQNLQEVVIQSHSGEIFTGIVSFISNIADNDTHTFRVEIEIANSDQRLLSGETVNVSLNMRQYLAHSIPQSAITLDELNNIQVKILNDDKTVTKKNVTIVDEEEKNIWVIGLNDFENIVVMG